MYALADCRLRDVKFGRAAREAPDAMGGLEEDKQVQRRKGGSVVFHNRRLLARRIFFNVFGSKLRMYFSPSGSPLVRDGKLRLAQPEIAADDRLPSYPVRWTGEHGRPHVSETRESRLSSHRLRS